MTRDPGMVLITAVLALCAIVATVAVAVTA